MDYRTSKLKKEDHFEVFPKIQGGDDESGIEIRVIWIYDFKELRLGVDCPLECRY